MTPLDEAKLIKVRANLSKVILMYISGNNYNPKLLEAHIKKSEDLNQVKSGLSMEDKKKSKGGLFG